MSLLSLHGVSLRVAENQILNQSDLHIQAQDRIALVGRNGAGKSTLLHLLQGFIQADEGQINQISGLRIAGLTQEVPVTGEESVYEILVKDLGETGQVLADFNKLMQSQDMDKMALCQQKMDTLNAWENIAKIETMAGHLGIDIQARMNDLSGGMKRRVLLAAALITAPDLLLLDEPTNHLDIAAIEWLESYLKNYAGSLILVTHDRAFLSAVSKSIIEIDRGKLYMHHCNYETYLDRRESIRLSEQKQNALFDKKLAEEETWIRTGIKARRTRNEGRVRALKALRAEYQARRKQLGTVKALAVEGERSGALVIEAKNINYMIDNKPLISNLSLLLTRGDKLGIIGPNGCGKTTLVRLLLGELVGHTGKIKQGTALQVAYFDQLRRQLYEDKSVMYNVGDGAEHVTINGKQKHVASYLKDFLFAPERFNQPVSTLSGGERNRLLLAKLFAKPVNFLVMDEPTNDLDIETLELLEEMLRDYPGTLILISHDRAFINQVVTSVLVYEKEGCFNEFVGDYDEYKAHQKQQSTTQTKIPASAPVKTSKVRDKLNFNEQRELQQLPERIEQLENKISALQMEMASPDFYTQEASLIARLNQTLADQEALLAECYHRWETLEGSA